MILIPTRRSTKTQESFKSWTTIEALSIIIDSQNRIRLPTYTYAQSQSLNWLGSLAPPSSASSLSRERFSFQQAKKYPVAITKERHTIAKTTPYPARHNGASFAGNRNVEAIPPISPTPICIPVAMARLRWPRWFMLNQQIAIGMAE